MRLIVSALLALSLVSHAGAQQRPLPDAGTFLAEARKRLATDDERQGGYVYVQTRKEQTVDKNGRATKESVTVSESYPGLPGDERWERITVDKGRTISERELADRDRKRQAQAESYARRLAQDPAKERARLDRVRAEDMRERAEAIDEVFRVYDFRLIGREALDGHDTIQFSLTPKANAKPRTRDGKIMTKFGGRVWVSESDYELVRLDVEAIDTASIGFGLLARVHKGSRFSFTRRKIDAVWLPAEASYSFSARVGLVAVMRRRVMAEFSNYRSFNVDTSTTYTKPKPPG
jgi:hypothetical protein